ncbi:hypothetical protein NM208_g5737 [Fusarium decemcellulare]|uniref:Uncharacterized protein n=1 Tax=Fusarium decemcellulare TaxID=57161 RepID=A0ACC1SFW5_9HYPO|nr:hypothetical protein NM208_g5737 [Fusarium decemcellulare]
MLLSCFHLPTCSTASNHHVSNLAGGATPSIENQCLHRLLDHKDETLRSISVARVVQLPLRQELELFTVPNKSMSQEMRIAREFTVGTSGTAMPRRHATTSDWAMRFGRLGAFGCLRTFALISPTPEENIGIISPDVANMSAIVLLLDESRLDHDLYASPDAVLNLAAYKVRGVVTVLSQIHGIEQALKLLSLRLYVQSVLNDVVLDSLPTLSTVRDASAAEDVIVSDAADCLRMCELGQETGVAGGQKAGYKLVLIADEMEREEAKATAATSQMLPANHCPKGTVADWLQPPSIPTTAKLGYRALQGSFFNQPPAPSQAVLLDVSVFATASSSLWQGARTEYEPHEHLARNKPKNSSPSNGPSSRGKTSHLLQRRGGGPDAGKSCWLVLPKPTGVEDNNAKSLWRGAALTGNGRTGMRQSELPKSRGISYVMQTSEAQREKA